MANYDVEAIQPPYLLAEHLDRYPELQDLVASPLDALLVQAAGRLGMLDATGSPSNFNSNDPLADWTLDSRTMTFAENDVAIERVRIQVGKTSLSAVYEALYKGPLGQVFLPDEPRWAVSCDTGGYFYWNQSVHGDTADLFALAASDCEEINGGDAEAILMGQYIGVGLYSMANPKARAELTTCEIGALDLASRMVERPKIVIPLLSAL
jgi:hypothetical protein